MCRQGKRWEEDPRSELFAGLESLSPHHRLPTANDQLKSFPEADVRGTPHRSARCRQAARDVPSAAAAYPDSELRLEAKTIVQYARVDHAGWEAGSLGCPSVCVVYDCASRVGLQHRRYHASRRSCSVQSRRSHLLDVGNRDLGVRTPLGSVSVSDRIRQRRVQRKRRHHVRLRDGPERRPRVRERYRWQPRCRPAVYRGVSRVGHLLLFGPTGRRRNMEYISSQARAIRPDSDECLKM